MISLHEGRGAGARRGRRPRILTLRLTIAAVHPPIWRRLLVRETMKLGRLHEAVQVLFGWCDYQTHVFSLGKKRCGNPVSRGGLVIEDDRLVTLADAGFSDRATVTYDYQFAEGWRVDLRVEGSAAAKVQAVYPRCAGGARAGVPEDCGGPEAYADMLFCLKHPHTDLGREWRKWLGPDYDPEQYNLAAINRALRRLAK
jgi:hypothetical protein